ncbi:MAG: HAD family hydrolase [Oscillospiraceae bacterium]|jgi:hypothetical protein
MRRDYSNFFVITDLDGTLLPHSKIISDIDLKSIEAFISLGGRFSIATGRPVQSVLLYIQKLNVNMPVILYNGSMIYDFCKNKPVWSVFLNNSVRELIKNVLNEFPDVSAEILTFDEVYAIQINDAERHHIEVTKTTPIICSVDEAPDGWLKALFAADPERLIDVISYINGLSVKNVTFVQSCRFFYEMVPENVSKGSALNKLIEICGCKNVKTLAVGDYYNDSEMIKAADIGFAVSNAQDEVKQIADIVLNESCEENAISKIIEYIISENNDIMKLLV